MALIKILNDNSPMPVGKYQGKKMADVPASYLLWYESTAPLKRYLKKCIIFAVQLVEIPSKEIVGSRLSLLFFFKPFSEFLNIKVKRFPVLTNQDDLL